MDGHAIYRYHRGMTAVIGALRVDPSPTWSVYYRIEDEDETRIHESLPAKGAYSTRQEALDAGEAMAKAHIDRLVAESE